MTLLEAISPTARELLELQFFPCGYTWQDKTLGELNGHTVITGVDAEAALNHFRSLHPHLTRAWIVNPQPEPECAFVRHRAFLRKEHQ